VITLKPQKEVSWMEQMKMSEDSLSHRSALVFPSGHLHTTHNQSKALASSRDYHEVIITNISVNMSRQTECNRKACWKKKRNQSTDM